MSFQVEEASKHWSVADPVEAFRDGWWAAEVAEAGECTATVVIPSSGETLTMPSRLVRRRYSWQPEASWEPTPAEGPFAAVTSPACLPACLPERLRRKQHGLQCDCQTASSVRRLGSPPSRAECWLHAGEKEARGQKRRHGARAPTEPRKRPKGPRQGQANPDPSEPSSVPEVLPCLNSVWLGEDTG